MKRLRALVCIASFATQSLGGCKPANPATTGGGTTGDTTGSTAGTAAGSNGGTTTGATTGAATGTTTGTTTGSSTGATTGAGTGSSSAGGTSSGSTTGATSGGTTSYIDAEFGLDTRPANSTCVSRSPPAQTGAIALQSVFPSFFADSSNRGWIMAAYTFENSGERFWLVAYRHGFVAAYRQTSATAASAGEVILDISNLVREDNETYPPGEGGLLDMAIAPDFAANPMLYISYTRIAGQDGCPARNPGTEDSWQSPLCSHVSRFPVAFAGSGSTLTLSVGPEEPVRLQGSQNWLRQPTDNHNGGALAFGAGPVGLDYVLYVSFGDGGGGDDTFKNGQNPNTLHSKVLRLDVTCDVDNVSPLVPCSVPGNVPADTLVFASGFRNPWQLHVDRGTGVPWLSDVGQSAWEEIDRVQAGGNYGWPTHEASHFSGNTPSGSPAYPPAYPIPGAIDPIAEYATGSGTAPRSSVAAGFVYRGSALTSYVGHYFFSDVNSGELWRLAPSVFGGTTENVTNATADLAAEVERFHDGSLVGGATLHEDQDGEVYVASNYTGSFYRLQPGTPQSAPGFPALLSQTGCFDPLDPKQPVAGMIPYSVRSPLWSDEASKRRWLALPDNENITVESNGDFTFPNGSVLVKEFERDGVLIETRLYMRHNNAWNGYSYHWNESQSDAALANEGSTSDVAGRPWEFPGRGECADCHTLAAGVSLGLELQQQNSLAEYPATMRRSNQLATFEHIGLLTLPAPVANIDALPFPFGTDALDLRARSYLHSNCSNCHQPGGVAGPAFDLRFSTALADTGICNTTPTYGDLGLGAGARIVAPGEPGLSVLLQRMRATDNNRMPKLGTLIEDIAATPLIEQWIDSLSSCP